MTTNMLDKIESHSYLVNQLGIALGWGQAAKHVLDACDRVSPELRPVLLVVAETLDTHARRLRDQADTEEGRRAFRELRILEGMARAPEGEGC